MKYGTLEYWKKRCELAEAIVEASPCDPDITVAQINAFSSYKFFRRDTDPMPMSGWRLLTLLKEDMPPVGVRVILKTTSGATVISRLENNVWHDDDGTTMPLRSVVKWTNLPD